MLILPVRTAKGLHKKPGSSETVLAWYAVMIHENFLSDLRLIKRHSK
ncbi:MAG: hypothetical protein V4713_07035 [Pseudomonadota bacterium]